MAATGRASQMDNVQPGLIPDLADDLPDMLRRGRVAGDTSVVRVNYILTDGRLLSFDLPVPRSLTQLAPPSDEENGDIENDSDVLSGMEAAVLQAVNEMKRDEVLTREDIAFKSGFSCSGKMKVFISFLAATGKLKRVHRGFQRAF